MMHRLDATFINWLRTGQSASGNHEPPVPFIPGFEFNLESQLSEKLKLKLTISKSNENFIIVKVPAFVPVQKIVAPADTSSVRLKIVAVAYDFDNQSIVRAGLKEILIPYSSSEVTEQQIVFDLKPKTGDLYMAVIALNYYTSADGSTGLNDSMKWKPAAIAQAIIF